MMMDTVDTRFWDRTAERYASDPIKDMAGYERTLERTRQYLKPGDAVLELGCGTGLTALALAPSAARYTATDTSPAMVAIARQRAAEAGRGFMRCAIAGPEDAPMIEGGYDAVLAFNVLHLIHDRDAAFWHVKRLLKPGGLFIAKTPCLLEMNPLLRLLVPAMRIIGKAPYVSFFDAAGLERGMSEQGFRIVERARHGSGRRDARVFLVARKPEAPATEW
jgi:SAM-dependent methyltransferase